MTGYPADISGDIAYRATPPEAWATGGSALVRLVRLAAQILRAPGALIATPELDAPLFLTPTPADQTALAPWKQTNTRAICDYVIATGEPLLLRDLRRSDSGAAALPSNSHAVAYAGIPLRSPAGRILGVLCVLDQRPRDWTALDLAALHEIASAIEALPLCTESPRSEREIRQSLKLEAIGRLAGGVAHDFNNILTAIRGRAELLLDDLASADPRRTEIEEISRSTERAARLTHQLLAFSRRQLLRPQLLDLATLLPAWSAKLQGQLDAGIILQTSVEPDIGPVRADPRLIEEAIHSLVANARDASPQGGCITISATNALIDELFAQRFPYRVVAGPYARIIIEDAGQGMDEETLARIFDPYFTTREPGLGAGLGLSTVYGIVKQSGGYIWAASTPGRGTVVEIYLPIQVDQPCA
jgi:signal transduction histidine kinase